LDLVLNGKYFAIHSDMKLRDESDRCHGVLPYLNEAPALTAWQVLWFKQPPDLFPRKRFPFEQCLFDTFHPGAPLY